MQRLEEGLAHSEHAERRSTGWSTGGSSRRNEAKRRSRCGHLASYTCFGASGFALWRGRVLTKRADQLSSRPDAKRPGWPGTREDMDSSCALRMAVGPRRRARRSWPFLPSFLGGLWFLPLVLSVLLHPNFPFWHLVRPPRRHARQQRCAARRPTMAVASPV